MIFGMSKKLLIVINNLINNSPLFNKINPESKNNNNKFVKNVIFFII